MPQNSFSPDLWHELASQVAAAFKLSKDEAAKLEGNKTARLIAAIPYLAGCDHPARTALAHLGTFLLASTASCKKVFDHDPSDDKSPTARLAPIADFVGGDKAIIEHGMSLLAVIMANGYQQDIEKDKKSGEYNPINAGTWKADALSTRLMSVAAKTPAETAIDPVLTRSEAVRAFWSM